MNPIEWFNQGTMRPEFWVEQNAIDIASGLFSERNFFKLPELLNNWFTLRDRIVYM